MKHADGKEDREYSPCRYAMHSSQRKKAHEGVVQHKIQHIKYMFRGKWGFKTD